MALLLASSAIWLFLAAIPVLADNGPHMMSVNNGSAGINADSCAGCHRAHTAQANNLLIADEPGSCLACHGSTGTGATTDVVDGIQFGVGIPHSSSPAASSGVVGALRSGGFTQARIASGNPVRLSFQVPSGGNGFTGLVRVATTGAQTTSRHMNLDGSASGPGYVWGNYYYGQYDSTVNVGPTGEITCTSCHNPHGNNRYRILNAVPVPATTGSGFITSPFPVNVTDVPAVASGQTRNYTNSSAAYVSGIAGTPDYWRYCAPTWSSCTPSANLGDKPNGSTTFRGQISAWCATCHTRYLAGAGSANFDTTDPVFRYQHQTNRFPECTQCHVAHGSNASMSGSYSSQFPYPDGSISASSRLLKIDNRGTCQMCHDPTGTITSSGVTTP